jgi:hypothetical protein
MCLSVGEMDDNKRTKRERVDEKYT